jgi:uncharacterized protein with HEPN domain
MPAWSAPDRRDGVNFAIDLDVLWATITEDLPVLLASLPAEDAFTG